MKIDPQLQKRSASWMLGYIITKVALAITAYSAFIGLTVALLRLFGVNI